MLTQRLFGVDFPLLTKSVKYSVELTLKIWFNTKGSNYTRDGVTEKCLRVLKVCFSVEQSSFLTMHRVILTQTLSYIINTLESDQFSSPCKLCGVPETRNLKAHKMH